MTRDKKTQILIERMQRKEDRERARRISRIKTAVAQADFHDAELTAIETIVFGAYGRTKLR